VGTSVDYAYDATGRLTSAGDWSFGYSDQGLARVAAPDGSTTEYTYDSQDELVTADAGSDVVRFTYGPQRRVVRIVTAAATIDYSYDRAGEPVGRSDGTSTTQYQYDRQRNLVRSADARGETAEYDYDGDGSLLRAITGAAATRFGYGADGRLVEARGLGGDTTTFSYAGALLQFVAPDLGDDVLVSFEQGAVDKPYVVGYVYTDAGGESFTLSARGQLTGCSRCP
jgi:YD repeat-containing protein